MATKSRTCQYKYKFTMYYLDQINNTNKQIKNECIKYIIIDHNYDDNFMPIVYLNLRLDKELTDDMILNSSTNLVMLACFKYDDLTDEKQEIECFREKFTYFLPNDINKNDSIDYNEETEDEHKNNTFRQIVIGLLAIRHINANKQSFKFLLKNATIGEPVSQILDTFDNVIMEKIGDSTKIEQLVVPTKDSVSKMFKALNNIRVFYSTPYRYYQDFSNTYLISSAGNAIKRAGDTYTSVLINIKDAANRTANEEGFVINKTSSTYEMAVNYVNTQIYDNSISNKSKTEIVGMTSSGETKKSLKNTASYSTSKTQTVRLYNDNEGIIDNMEASDNSNNFIVYIQKVDLDTDLFTLNKRITIHHIDKYSEHNGIYLMYRKRECYLREDESFLLNTMINFRELQT